MSPLVRFRTVARPPAPFAVHAVWSTDDEIRLAWDWSAPFGASRGPQGLAQGWVDSGLKLVLTHVRAPSLVPMKPGASRPASSLLPSRPESVPGFVFGKAARAQWHALRSRRLRRQASTLPLRCLLGLGREGPATSGPGSGHVVGEEGRPVVPQADAPQGTGDGENNFCRDPSRRG